MGFKDQLIKIKDNWLIVVLLVVVLFFLMGFGNLSNGVLSGSSEKMMSDYSGYDEYSSNAAGGISRGGSDFAPQVEERKIVKTASISSEVERGFFMDAENNLKNIVSSSDSFLLYASSSRRGTDKKGYYYGSYSIKVDTKKYDSVVEQLKALGEVSYFNENANDITGSYTNANIELEAERERLRMYNELYSGLSTSTSDKIALVDKIYSQERTIKYWEDSLKNMDQRIDYSTVQVTLTEKSSVYQNIALVKFSNLVKDIVESFNALLHFLFVVLPWVVAGVIIWLLVRLFRRKA